MVTLKGSLIKNIHHRDTEDTEVLFFCFSLRRKKITQPFLDFNIRVLFGFKTFIITLLIIPLSEGLNAFPLPSFSKAMEICFFLCVLCASSEAGGEIILTYPHSKAGTFSIATGSMG